MPNTDRDLESTDIARLLALQAEAQDNLTVFAEAARLVAETCGYRLLTVLLYREADAEVERLYSSDPAYVVGGRKRLSDFPSNHAGMAQGDVFLAATKAEVAAAFTDHERIFALGISAILNAPIRHAGQRFGTLNLSGNEGQYGPRQIAAARTIAAALTPTLMVAVGRQ